MGCNLKQIFDILNSENIQTSLSTMKRIGLYFTKTASTIRKIGSVHLKATMKRDNQQIKFAALNNKKKTLTNLAKKLKTSDRKTLSLRSIPKRIKENGITIAFNKFLDFFVLAFKIVVDSWKFNMLLLYILWDDWEIFMISGSNELLQ